MTKALRTFPQVGKVLIVMFEITVTMYAGIENTADSGSGDTVTATRGSL